MQLQPLPRLPRTVKYALTVPQSVLFADLSLQGNTRKFFKEAMNINYEPKYIVIDADGAMSWNYENDNRFIEALTQTSSKTAGITHFIDSMSMTSRKLERRMYLRETTLRRRKNSDDLIEDLDEYWHAYKLHMTSLFVFWNVQHLLAEELNHTNPHNGLETNISPTETNQFVRERQIFEKIVKRFALNSVQLTTKNTSDALLNALNHHAREFAFLLNPFNLSTMTSGEMLLPRVIEFQQNINKDIAIEEHNPIPSSVSTQKSSLRVLAQRLVYWKNERLDVLSLADASVEPLYQQVADFLSINLNDLFYMTSDEILQSLQKRKSIISASKINQRKKAYCLALIKSNVGFYTPSTKTNLKQKYPVEKITNIQGVIASSGKVTGKVRLILTRQDFTKLHQGEILLTKMTRPEFGEALDRAAAFVTDEGGLLCHAAIIAREMKKPCIISTKIATQVFKNGDFVEVDAINGIIKLISRN